MLKLAIALALLAQDPTVAELLRNLQADDIEVREEAERALGARGPAALAEVEAALARSGEGVFRTRLKRVVYKLRLAEVLDRVPSQFSESFRAAEPDLLDRLKTGDPQAIIDALAATTGRAIHWEMVDQPARHGKGKARREITREVSKGATRADAAEVMRIALRASPPESGDEKWSAVTASATSAVKYDQPEDRRRLFVELLPGRGNAWLRGVLLQMVAMGREPDDMPVTFAALDLGEDDFTKKAAMSLLQANPGPHAPEVAKRMADFKPPLRRNFLYALRNSGDRRFLKLFEEFLDKGDGDEAGICLQAIQKLAPETLPALHLKWIRTGRPDLMKQGLQPYVMPRPTAPVPIPEIMEEAYTLAFGEAVDPYVRGTAFAVLRNAAPEKYRTWVIEALSSSRPEIHGWGLREAGMKWDEDVRPGVEKLADSPDESTAFEATALLAYRCPFPNLDPFRKALKSADPSMRKRAITVLSSLMQYGVRTEIAPLLEDPDLGVRKTTVMTLRQLSKGLEVPIRDKLVTMVEDPDPGLRRDALGALWGNGKGIEEKIRPLLESKDSFTVLSAVRILNLPGDKSILPHIRKGLNSEHYEDYLHCFIYQAEPTWLPILQSTVFKIPPKDPTVRDVVEGLRTALRDKGIEVRFELPEERLGDKFFVPGVSEMGWRIGWTRTMIRESNYFFDGKTLFILSRAEAGKRWQAWVDSK